MCYTFCYTYISDTENSFLFKGFKCVIGFESPMSHLEHYHSYDSVFYYSSADMAELADAPDLGSGVL